MSKKNGNLKELVLRIDLTQQSMITKAQNGLKSGSGASRVDLGPKMRNLEDFTESGVEFSADVKKVKKWISGDLGRSRIGQKGRAWSLATFCLQSVPNKTF